MAYAMSLFSAVTFETLTPGASSNSYLVTVGPTTIPTSLVSTPCVANARSRTRPLSSTSASLTSLVVERSRTLIEGNFQGEPFAPGPSSISSCSPVSRGPAFFGHTTRAAFLNPFLTFSGSVVASSFFESASFLSSPWELASFSSGDSGASS